MNFFCEDCKIPSGSYEDWVTHLVTPQHQLISATKIKQWVSEKNPSCIIMVSIFLSKDPLEIARKFSKFGFLWNFYAHSDHKFFIMQYDNKQTASFTLKKVNEDLPWKIQIRPLIDLTTEDWVSLFPPAPPAPVVEPPPKIARLNSLNSFSSISGLTTAVASNYQQSVNSATVSSIPISNNIHSGNFRQPINSSLFAKNSSVVQIIPNQGNRVNNSNSNKEPIGRNSQASILPNPIHKSVARKPETKTASLVNLEPPSLEKGPSTSFALANIDHKLVNQLKDNSDSSTSNSQEKSAENVKLKGELRLSMEYLMQFTKGTSLDEQLDSFYKAAAISLKELEKIKEVVVSSLTEILKHVYPDCSLYLFDTFQGGVGNNNLYVEINLDGLESKKQDSDTIDTKTEKKLEEKLCEKLIAQVSRDLENEMNSLGSKFCKDIFITFKGQNSRVSFKHPISSRHKFLLTCCATPSQYTRKRHFKLIDFFVKLHPTVRSLLCFVHYWSNHHQFMQFGFQQIKDYVLSLMVIIFLAKKNVVPTLQKIQNFARHICIDFSESESLENVLDNAESVSKIISQVQKQFKPKEIYILDLAKEYFEFYGKRDLSTEVICTWTANILPRTVFMLERSNLPSSLTGHNNTNLECKLDLTTPLCVQSVFEPTFNIGRTTTDRCFRKILKGYRQAAVLLDKLLNKTAEHDQDLMSVFAPIEKEIEQVVPKPDNSKGPKPPRESKPQQARICEITFGRIQEKMQAMNIIFPVCGNERLKYIVLDLEDCFVQEFKRTVLRYPEYRVDQQTIFNHMCGLWSTFALEFVRTVWSKCWFTDAVEHKIFEQFQAPCYNDSFISLFGTPFPLATHCYYGVFQIGGYLPLRPGFRWQCRTSGQYLTPKVVIAGSQFSRLKNPFDEEWAITEISLERAKVKKETGKTAWKIECTVVYESVFSDHKVPRLCIVLGGGDHEREVLDYLASGIKRLFQPYQHYQLDCWFTQGAAATATRPIAAAASSYDSNSNSYYY